MKGFHLPRWNVRTKRTAEEPPPAPKTILWLGAHKTGTTYLQRSLDLSKDALWASGVFYLELLDFRGKYGRPLLDGRSEPAPNEYQEPGNRVNLIFDENIPGYVQGALRPRGLYSEMTTRIDRILEYLELVPDEIVFGIRSYDSFYPSLYCETLKSTKYQTFEQFLSKSLPRHKQASGIGPTIDRMSHMRWIYLLDRIARYYPQVKVQVYFYEQLRGNEARLLSSVTGVPADQFDLLGDVERSGFSARAVEVLYELSTQGPVSTNDVREVVSKYPRSAELPGFNPFEDATRQVLHARYRQDIAELRQHNRISVIELT